MPFATCPSPQPQELPPGIVVYKGNETGIRVWGCWVLAAVVIAHCRYVPYRLGKPGRLSQRPGVYGLDGKQLEAIGGQKKKLSSITPNSHESNLTRRAR